MKTTVLTLTLAFFSSFAFGQDKEKLYDLMNEYSQRKGSFSVSLNKDMLDAVDLDIDVDEYMKNISGDIYEVKLLLFSDDDEAQKLIKKLEAGIIRSGFDKQEFELHDNDLQFLGIYGDNHRGRFQNVQILTLTETNNVILLAINGKLKVKNVQ